MNLAPTLEYLDISESFFVGEIPSQIGKFSNLKIFLASGNDFHGRLPTEVGFLERLEELGKFSTKYTEQQNMKSSPYRQSHTVITLRFIGESSKWRAF